jgi:hypothetical protein
LWQPGPGQLRRFRALEVAFPHEMVSCLGGGGSLTVPGCHIWWRMWATRPTIFGGNANLKPPPNHRMMQPETTQPETTQPETTTRETRPRRPGRGRQGRGRRPAKRDTPAAEAAILPAEPPPLRPSERPPEASAKGGEMCGNLAQAN